MSGIQPAFRFFWSHLSKSSVEISEDFCTSVTKRTSKAAIKGAIEDLQKCCLSVRVFTILFSLWFILCLKVLVEVSRAMEVLEGGFPACFAAHSTRAWWRRSPALFNCMCNGQSLSESSLQFSSICILLPHLSRMDLSRYGKSWKCWRELMHGAPLMRLYSRSYLLWIRKYTDDNQSLSESSYSSLLKVFALFAMSNGLVDEWCRVMEVSEGVCFGSIFVRLVVLFLALTNYLQYQQSIPVDCNYETTICGMFSRMDLSIIIEESI